MANKTHPKSTFKVGELPLRMKIMFWLSWLILWCFLMHVFLGWDFNPLDLFPTTQQPTAEQVQARQIAMASPLILLGDQPYAKRDFMVGEFMTQAQSCKVPLKQQPNEVNLTHLGNGMFKLDVTLAAASTLVFGLAPDGSGAYKAVVTGVCIASANSPDGRECFTDVGSEMTYIDGVLGCPTS